MDATIVLIAINTLREFISRVAIGAMGKNECYQVWDKYPTLLSQLAIKTTQKKTTQHVYTGTS